MRQIHNYNYEKYNTIKIISNNSNEIIEAVDKQELHCHNCHKYIQFELNMSIDGNHILNCPNCGHEHCRVIENGIITKDRWDSRNKLKTYKLKNNFTSTRLKSTWDTYKSKADDVGKLFLYESWMNTTCIN